jgi:hypothetical protein
MNALHCRISVFSVNLPGNQVRLSNHLWQNPGIHHEEAIRRKKKSETQILGFSTGNLSRTQISLRERKSPSDQHLRAIDLLFTHRRVKLPSGR